MIQFNDYYLFKWTSNKAIYIYIYNLELVSSFNNIDTIFDFKLSFSHYTETVKNKVIRILGFISRDFRHYVSLKTPYIAL